MFSKANYEKLERFYNEVVIKYEDIWRIHERPIRYTKLDLDNFMGIVKLYNSQNRPIPAEIISEINMATMVGFVLDRYSEFCNRIKEFTKKEYDIAMHGSLDIFKLGWERYQKICNEMKFIVDNGFRVPDTLKTKLEMEQKTVEQTVGWLGIECG